MNQKSALFSTFRKKRQSIVTVAQMIAMLSIALFAFSLIVFVLISRYSEQKQRTEQMRASYVSLQKDITRREVERVVASINERRGNSRHVAMTKAKERVYQAYAIAENIYKTFKDTKSPREVLETILSALRPVRFDQGGYYFVDTLDGRILLIADRPEIEGKHYSTFASKKEQAVVVSLIDVAKRKEEGFFEYKWTMPGKQGSGHHKISYLKLFKPYNLIIGTGLYLEDVEAVMKRELIEEISNIRYGHNGYFFINDFRGNVLAHGYQPNMVGASNWDYTDSRGNKLFQDLRKVVQNPKGGFCYYWWKMPETGKERPKIAFAKAVPEWKWLIGTGVYLDKVEADIKNMQVQLRNESIWEISLILFVTIAIIILVYVIMGILFIPLRRDICFFNECFALAAQQDVSIDEEKIKFTELLKIAENANVMLREKEQFLQKLQDDKKEMKALQAQLIQSQKMESVGRLAGGVAHDFNNMLGVILGHVEFALEKAEENHDLSDDLNEIQKAAQRSANLTKQLLTFARKDIISPKRIDLNDTVESMLNMLRRIIGENIDLVWQPAAHLWPMKMDPTQIDQILANLCVNARDSIAGVGKLTIETGKKSFDQKYCWENAGFSPGDYVLLAVSDNGCGMDKNTLDNLFEPFFTTKEVGKGTGLGLATIYGIVKQNKGFIDVYSEPGQGSTFNIYLPRFITDEEADMVMPEEKLAAGGTETILLVEDEPTILRMTRMMLERKGYSVLTAATPGEAIDLAKTHADKIHLLMTDVIMPEMNGRDLAKQITALYPCTRLLFMSGYTSNVIAHQGILDDGVAFIQKPFSMADMTEKVREVLDTAPDQG